MLNTSIYAECEVDDSVSGSLGLNFQCYSVTEDFLNRLMSAVIHMAPKLQIMLACRMLSTMQ